MRSLPIKRHARRSLNVTASLQILERAALTLQMLVDWTRRATAVCASLDGDVSSNVGLPTGVPKWWEHALLERNQVVLAVRRGTLLFTVLTACLCSASGLVAQQCPVQLTTDGSSLGYRFRTTPKLHSTRCEGSYVSPVSGASISLVSYTMGPVTYDVNRDRELHISVSGIVADTNVIATRLVPRRYYRLDAKVTQKQPILVVPIDDVIGRIPVPAGELGVFGLRQITSGVLGYVPVKAAAPAKFADSRPTLVIQADIDISDVEWRISELGRPERNWEPVDGGMGLVPEGATLTISLGNKAPSTSSQFEVTYYVGGVPRTSSFILVPR